MKPGTTLYSRHWEEVRDLVAQRRDSGCMGSGCCWAGIKGNLMVPLWSGRRETGLPEHPVGIKGHPMVLLCSGHRETWLFLGHSVDMMGIPCLFGHNNQVMELDVLKEAWSLTPGVPGMFGVDRLATDGCTLDTCHRAEYEVTPGCMQGVGPKIPGIDSAAAEQPGQGAAPSLRTGCWFFRQDIESWLVILVWAGMQK